MSSRILLSRLALALAACSLVACVDPKKRLDDFEERVTDATPTIDGSGALFDISGEFLLTIAPGFFPDRELQFVATSTVGSAGGATTVDFSFQPLFSPNCEPPAGDSRTPVGDPLVADDIAVSDSGGFSLSFMPAVVDKNANAVSCGKIVADIILTGFLKSEDLYCGEVSGMVMEPLPQTLDGSTFAAIRVPAGTIGDDLPDTVPACPAEGGDFDAGPDFDAGDFDAAL